MAATVTMVPLAKIKPRAGFNPRSEFADEQMAELVEGRDSDGAQHPLHACLRSAHDARCAKTARLGLPRGRLGAHRHSDDEAR
jgi:hypothetical protein